MYFIASSCDLTKNDDVSIYLLNGDSVICFIWIWWNYRERERGRSNNRGISHTTNCIHVILLGLKDFEFIRTRESIGLERI